MTAPPSAVRGRILCLTSNFPRWKGDTTTPFILHLNQDLIAEGWQVDVLAPHFAGARLAETWDGMRVFRFRYAIPEAAQTTCYGGGALVNLRRRPLERVKLPALVLAQWASAQRLVWKERYHVLHSHWLLPQGFVGSAVARLSGVPHVTTIHGGDLATMRGPILTRFKRETLRQVDAVTANSSYTEAVARDLFPHPHSHRIPMGVDDRPLSAAERDRATQFRREFLGSHDGPLVVFLGRLVEEKGPQYLLEALPTLLRSCPGARVVIAGEGPLRPDLERQIQQLRLTDRAQLCGWIDPGHVRSFLACADVFVGPSCRARDGWVEAQGLTFLEAMGVETPVVASRSGGIVDAVLDEQTGLLVEERDALGIAAQVTRLHRDPDLAARLVVNARALLADRFTREACARSFSNLYDEVRRRKRP